MTDLPYGWKFKKGNHEIVRTLTFQGMSVAIETDKGQYRHWHDHESGENGKTLMHYPYGYFQGTKKSGQSGDGMALDVYVGPVENAEDVYVVHQMKRPEFKVEDELKVMVGFESLKQARAAYLMHYYDERFLGSVDTLTVAEFKDKYITPFIKKAMMDMPPGHLPGMVVPKGGSSCSSCKFVSEDKEHCSNSYWIKWQKGNTKLPAAADQYCCDMYDSIKHIDQPPVKKALAGKDVGQIFSSAAGNSPAQFVNPSGVPPVQGMPMPGVPPVPSVTPGMGMMGPPPIDVETFDGVKSLLGRIGNMKDNELLNLIQEIWGPGYSYINATTEHVRCEALGFLLDQRDLLELMEPQQPSTISPVSIPPPLASSSESSNLPKPMEEASSDVNLPGSESVSRQLTDSNQQAPLKNSKMDRSNRIEFQTASQSG